MGGGEISGSCRTNEENRNEYRILFEKPEVEERLCGLVVRVLGYRSGGPGSIPGTTRKK
jgi:hypothetical protein